jgi:hypothetical protein
LPPSTFFGSEVVAGTACREKRRRRHARWSARELAGEQQRCGRVRARLRVGTVAVAGVGDRGSRLRSLSLALSLQGGAMNTLMVHRERARERREACRGASTP